MDSHFSWFCAYSITIDTRVCGLHKCPVSMVSFIMFGHRYSVMNSEKEFTLPEMFSGHPGLVGHLFLNIIAHMNLVQAVHSNECMCPHCGGDGATYLRWTCCDAGMKENIDEAYQSARDAHQQYVKENKAKRSNHE